MFEMFKKKKEEQKLKEETVLKSGKTYVEAPAIEESKSVSKGPVFYPGKIVMVEGFRFRITEAKRNGRLFLKMIQ